VGGWLAAAYRVDAAVAVVLKLALAVCAGLCCEGTGEEDEPEADESDHCGIVWERGLLLLCDINVEEG
jgi:hypothetical protein